MGIHSRRYQLPPIELLPTFEAAARNLSFTKAGAELFLTQSAVSRQIQLLEVAVGGKLFERRTRSLLLTDRGLTLYRATQDVLARLDSTTRSLRGISTMRPVTLTTTPGFASLWLIPRLARFTSAHPGIDVRTSATNQLIDVERSGMDLAVRFSTPEHRFGGQRLFGGEVTLVCSPRLVPDDKRSLADPAALRQFTVLYLDDPNAGWFDWNVWFHALGLRDFHPTRQLHFSHYDQVIQAAVNGQGIALGVDPLVRALLREGKLVAPFRKTTVPARAWYLLRSNASTGQPEVDAFVDWLLAETKAEAASTRRTRKVR